MNNRYLAYFDGSSTPNPGIMTVGGIIKNANKKIVYKYSLVIGDGTNNIAEYLSLIHTLKQAVKIGIQQITIKGDSELIINQVNGIFKVRNQNMKKLYYEVLKLKNQIPDCKIVWVPRSKNREADRLT